MSFTYLLQICGLQFIPVLEKSDEKPNCYSETDSRLAGQEMGHLA